MDSHFPLSNILSIVCWLPCPSGLFSALLGITRKAESQDNRIIQAASLNEYMRSSMGSLFCLHAVQRSMDCRGPTGPLNRHCASPHQQQGSLQDARGINAHKGLYRNSNKLCSVWTRKDVKRLKKIRNSRRTVFFCYAIYLIWLRVNDSFPEYLKAEIEAYPPNALAGFDQVRSACAHLKTQLF